MAPGNASTVIYFDALWRPRLTRTLDTTNDAGTAKTVLRNFDIDNRKVFESYPARTIASVNATPVGSSTTFDALGRPVSAFETPRINLQPHARIDDHPCRIAANNTPHVEHRIVRHCRSNPHDDGIHRSPEAVHMIERRLAVNPPAFPRRSRNPPIERLP